MGFDLSSIFPKTTGMTDAFKNMAQQQGAQGGGDAGGGGGAPQAGPAPNFTMENLDTTFTEQTLKRTGEDSAWLDDSGGGYDEAGGMAEDVTG